MPVKYRDWYNGKAITLQEINRVNKKLKELDSEDLEFLYDTLPKSNRPRKKPYTHIPKELGYPVLNMGMETLKKGLKKANLD